MTYHALNYLSLASVSVALLLACLLPSVRTSIYFHRQHYTSTSEGRNSALQLTPSHQTQQGGGGGDGWLLKMKEVGTRERESTGGVTCYYSK